MQHSVGFWRLLLEAFRKIGTCQRAQKKREIYNKKVHKNLEWNFEFTNWENDKQFDKQKLKLTSLAID